MRQEVTSQVVGGRAYMFFYGDLTAPALIEAAVALTRRPDFHPGMGVLCDARCASLSAFSIHDLVEIGLAAESNTARRGRGGRSALVVGERDRWTADMLSTINNGRLPGDLRIFQDMEEARAWLERGPEGGGEGGEGGEKDGPDPASLAWCDTHNTGDAVIDGQHRRLFDLIAHCHQPREADADRTRAGSERMVQEFARCMAEHVVAEERLMCEHGYPLLDAHRIQHRGVTARIETLLGAWRLGQLPQPQVLPQLLGQWLTRHIAHHDRPLIHWCREGKGTRDARTPS